MDTPAKKSLGQHWLTDTKTLDYIVGLAKLQPGEVVLEVGPGKGSLTNRLLEKGAKVVAVEKDETLAAQLANKLSGRAFYLHSDDILRFDLARLPAGYKVVANIPYYLTSKLLRVLSESDNPPSKMVLLLQKEVAQRVCAGPGQMSILSVSVQIYYQCQLGRVVSSKLFRPPPKVDSQVIILDRRQELLSPDFEQQRFFRVVKAGFSERRKKLRSALAGGLGINKNQADKLLEKAGIDGDRRAQELSLADWHRLLKLYEALK